MVGERSNEGSTDSTVEFGERLQELKSRGCAVLVVGAVPSDVHVGLCRRMLGGRTDPPRQRLLVFTNGTVAMGSRVPGAGSAAGPGFGGGTSPGPNAGVGAGNGASRVEGETHVITTATARSTASVVGADRNVPVVDLAEPSLAELGAAISEVFEGIERRNEPLEPAQLRFCLDSLSPLLDAHDEAAVFQFLVVLTGYVRAMDGMGHFHLPLPRQTYAARLVAPLFDAVVELRVGVGEPEHRWHLRDDGITSQWLPL